LVSASGATVGKAGADDAEEVAWPADGLRASVMRRTDANRLELQFEVDGCVWTGVRSLSEFKWLAQARRLVRPHAQPCVEPRNGLDCGCRAAVRLAHPTAHPFRVRPRLQRVRLIGAHSGAPAMPSCLSAVGRAERVGEADVRELDAYLARLLSSEVRASAGHARRSA
jgi:hypothetical protein